MKNLEDEYRKSQQEQVPQLWNRIENNLPEKKKKSNIAYLSRILGICAAAAIVLLVVPKLWNLNRGNSNTECAPELSAEEYGLQNDLMENPQAAQKDISEAMKVIDCTEVDSLQIYTLERADGSTLCASLSEDIRMLPEIGKTYLFTVIQDSQNTEYLIVNKIEEVQN